MSVISGSKAFGGAGSATVDLKLAIVEKGEEIGAARMRSRGLINDVDGVLRELKKLLVLDVRLTVALRRHPLAKDMMILLLSAAPRLESRAL